MRIGNQLTHCVASRSFVVTSVVVLVHVCWFHHEEHEASKPTPAGPSDASAACMEYSWSYFSHSRSIVLKRNTGVAA